jgi:hypothetical protein
MVLYCEICGLAANEDMTFRAILEEFGAFGEEREDDQVD